LVAGRGGPALCTRAMIFRPSELTNRANYQLLIAALIPRPIAWVSSVSAAGAHNLAPFSFFAGVSAAPLTMMVSVGRRKGQRKDTANNLLQLPECVVHIPSRAMANAMVASSAEVDPLVDEFELTGVSHVPAEHIAARRITVAPVAFECRVSKHVELGSTDIFFLEALQVHVDDSILGEDGLPDAVKLDAVGRLGRNEYCVVDHVLRIDRPGVRD
jgi:flavin reductase (DIM6/NTAB) family NADH-FMN oxidoreductase RutF